MSLNTRTCVKKPIQPLSNSFNSIQPRQFIIFKKEVQTQHSVITQLHIDNDFTQKFEQKMNNFVSNCRKIVGAGINYRPVIEASGIKPPKEPIIFFKSTSTIIKATGDPDKDFVEIPKIFNELVFEAELGVVIGKKGKNIPRSEALSYISGYCITLDMTGMEFIKEARPQGLPWCLGKGFDTATPVGEFIPVDKLPNPRNIRVWSKVNGVTKQDDTTANLIFSIEELICYVSKYMSLEPNDLLLSGTPLGSGNVYAGDIIECGIENLSTIKFSVKQE